MDAQKKTLVGCVFLGLFVFACGEPEATPEGQKSSTSAMTNNCGRVDLEPCAPWTNGTGSDGCDNNSEAGHIHDQEMCKPLSGGAGGTTGCGTLNGRCCYGGANGTGPDGCFANAQCNFTTYVCEGLTATPYGNCGSRNLACCSPGQNGTGPDGCDNNSQCRNGSCGPV